MVFVSKFYEILIFEISKIWLSVKLMYQHHVCLPDVGFDTHFSTSSLKWSVNCDVDWVLCLTCIIFMNEHRIFRNFTPTWKPKMKKIKINLYNKLTLSKENEK